ncbi:TPA: hypothetical protein N2E03_003749 [Clostridium botulinum]|nr:hypothetical protein [Clostridium botulinum]HCL4561044.1 hypothetical protein [Clostridium botulinum]HCL4568876.1 hypothetical protein [Clostridium botulinum]HCL4571811.1 hypothetical protein [Clostridium botulinum]HCL4582718.1 hypothetical protein [Clostridium botulinum]
MNSIDKLNIVLDRMVPITDPTYIVGEKQAIEKLNSIFNSMESRDRGLIGCVILGQVGNGKTHFLRYVRQYYGKNRKSVGIYIPDMFVSGPLVDSLNGIYKSLFNGPGNKTLKSYYNEWNNYKKNETECTDKNNDIIKRLLLCTTEIEEKLILDYYSNIDLIPDQTKYLRSRFGLKKRLIKNENEFYKTTGDALEFINIISKKNILLLFDEIDKLYSSETNKVRLSAVQAKILTAYRGLFDTLNNRNIRGIIAIGATPEAWDILSTQGAFERRFKDNKILLKVPKSREDCEKFIENRFDELNFELTNEDKAVAQRIIAQLAEEKRRTWSEVISNIKNYSRKSIEVKDDPYNEIMNILNDAIAPLSWNEIVEESNLLKKLYPKSQPTTVLKKLEKENKIKINNTKPRTYEVISGRNDD